MSPQIEPPHFAADKDLMLSVRRNTDELQHPLDPHLKRKTEVAAEVATAVVAAMSSLGRFAQPVWITASPLTCSDLVEPEQRSEK